MGRENSEDSSEQAADIAMLLKLVSRDMSHQTAVAFCATPEHK